MTGEFTGDGWEFYVRGYYGPGGRKDSRTNPNRGRVGEREHDLALEVGCKGESVVEAEVLAFKAREDIGTITVMGPDGSRSYTRMTEGWTD